MGQTWIIYSLRLLQKTNEFINHKTFFMRECKYCKNSPVVRRLVEQGYSLCCYFLEDQMVCTDNYLKRFPISGLQGPMLCMESNLIIYTFSVGKDKGHVALELDYETKIFNT